MKKFTITVEVEMNDYQTVDEVHRWFHIYLRRLTDNTPKVTVVSERAKKDESAKP